MNDVFFHSEGETRDCAEEAIPFLPAISPEALQLDESHFAFFCVCYPQPLPLASGEEAGGKSPRDWYAGAPAQKPGADLERFGNKVNRSRLIALQGDASVPTLDLCIAILAWGGMRGSNRTHLFKRPVAPWLDVAERIRDGAFTRSGAFDAFAALNHNGSLVGMGPAYYTKLIYFLSPRDGVHPIGYIMDQWVGCSINLICRQDVVQMNSIITWVRKRHGNSPHILREAASHVSPLNTGEEYERFCRAVELVAEQMGAGWAPDAAELALMSRGGQKREAWRKYVVRHRLRGLGI